MEKKYALTIIGGGVVGCAIAYEFSRRGVKNVVVVEKNSTIPGLNQSSRNGGVIHSGVYYPHSVEPLKAKLCVEGNTLLYDFAQKFNVPYKKTGKLILATTPADDVYLQFFYAIGLENGIPGLQILSGKEARAIEPLVSTAVTSALLVPSCGSIAIDPFVETLKTLAEHQGVTFLTGHEAIEISVKPSYIEIQLKITENRKKLQTEQLINAAGVSAAEIAHLVNDALNYHIEPTRGELFAYSPLKYPHLKTAGLHLYPVPFCYDNETKAVVNDLPEHLLTLLQQGKITKTLGAHVSPFFTHSGNNWSLTKTISVGPLKTIGLGKENYTQNLHPADDYVERVKSYFPHLKAEQLYPLASGIMAVLRGHTDFVVTRDPQYLNVLHLIGMDSPALTASLAIAAHTYQLYVA